MLINGLYRHGFMISPAVMDCALELLEEGNSKTAMDLGLRVNKVLGTQEEGVCA